MKNATIGKALMVTLDARGVVCRLATKIGNKFYNALFDAVNNGAERFEYEGWSIPIDEALLGIQDYCVNMNYTAKLLASRIEAEAVRLKELDTLLASYQVQDESAKQEVVALDKKAQDNKELADAVNKRKQDVYQNVVLLETAIKNAQTKRDETKQLVSELTLSLEYSKSDSARLEKMAGSAIAFLSLKN